MKKLARILCLSVLALGLSTSPLMANSTAISEASSNDKPVYLMSVIKLKGDKVNRALRKTLKKIAQTARKFNGEALGDFTLEQPLNQKLTLVVKLPNDSKLVRFQRLADAHYVKLRKSVEAEYRFVAVASDSSAIQNDGYAGPFTKIRDIKGQYPERELLLSQE